MAVLKSINTLFAPVLNSSSTKPAKLHDFKFGLMLADVIVLLKIN